MIDYKLQAELRAKYNPEGSQLRKSQHRMVELLAFLDKICKKHGLTYWLDSGTLLGAVRHGGFIPWDDDTDVCMPRKDALKLIEIMGNEIWDDHIILQSRNNEKNFPHSTWFVLKDTKSEYVSSNEIINRFKYRGLQVDIFMVKEGITPWIFKWSRRLHMLLIQWPITGHHHLGMFRWMAKYNVLLEQYLINPIFRMFMRRDKKMAYGLGTTFYNPHPYDSIYPLSIINFEGYGFNAPKDTDNYLTAIYGDWRKIPDHNHIAVHSTDIKFFD